MTGIEDPLRLSEAVKLWTRINPLPVLQLPVGAKLSKHLRDWEFLIIGRTLIRSRKIGNLWHLSAGDLHRAAQDLQRLVEYDPADVVEIGRRDHGWQGDLARDLQWAKDEGCFHSPRWGFLHLSDVCTKTKKWAVPTAYAEVIADGKRLDTALQTKRRLCRECNAPVESPWKAVQDESGWLTLCHGCEGVHYGRLIPYTNELYGVKYTSVRGRSSRAVNYLCVCCDSQATYWDHCHQHGYIRGPLCATCNSRDAFAQTGSVEVDAEHFLRCKECKDSGNIPSDVLTNLIVSELSKVVGVAAPDCHPLLLPQPAKGITLADVRRVMNREGDLIAFIQCPECGETTNLLTLHEAGLSAIERKIRRRFYLPSESAEERSS